MSKTFEFDGVKYQEVVRKGCFGCIAEDNHLLCSGLPQCAAKYRKDKNSVIFVKYIETTQDYDNTNAQYEALSKDVLYAERY